MQQYVWFNSLYKSSGLLSQMDRLSLQSPLRPLSVLVFYLLLAHSCRGQSQLIGPLQPLVARVGEDIILPCHLKPAVDVVAMTLEWKRPDLASEFVLVWRDGQDFVLTKNPSYKERSYLFIDELKRGNISLKLSKVQLSDQGTYECYIPDLDKRSSVKLVVGESELISSPQQIVATVGDDVILPCHLEPAVDVAARTLEWTRPDLNHRSVHVWRDGQDLVHVKDPSYTGRTSLFTNGLKHGNISLKLSKVKPSDEGRYQCGIPDMNTESFIELVVDDFFNVQSSSVPVITGLAVSLAVWIILFILLLLFVVWKWRQIRIKTKRSCRGQTEKGEKKNGSEVNKSEDQCVSEEREREQLMTHETVEMEVLKGNGEKEIKHFKKKRFEQQLQEEERREDAEKEVQTLKEELETKKNEMERIKNTQSSSSFHSLMKEKQQAAEAQLKKISEELKEAKHQLKMKDESVSQLMREFNKQLSDEKQKKEGVETDLKRQLSKIAEWQQKFYDEKNKREEAEKEVKNVKKEMQTKEQAADMNWKKTDKELKERESQLKIKTEEISQLKRNLSDQQQKKEKAERELKELKTKNTERQQKLHDEKTKREEAEKKVENPKKEMKDKSSSASQSSNTEPFIVVQVNQKDKYIRLKNKSHQDQLLGGWRLEMQINEKIISYRFEKSFKLKSGSTVSMSGPDCVQRCDLHWKDLTSWNPEDNLKFFLISNTDVRYQLSSCSLSGY